MRFRIAIAGAFAVGACVPGYQFSGEDAGTASDAGGDAAAPPFDAGTNADTATAPDVGAFDSALLRPFIECHSGGGNVFTLCNLGQQACCGVFASDPDFCVDIPDIDAACTFPEAATALIACDDPSQCSSGSVCCASNLDLGNQTYSAIGCMAAASCVAPFGVVCGNVQGGAVDGGCPAGKACTGQIDDYYFCN